MLIFITIAAVSFGVYRLTRRTNRPVCDVKTDHLAKFIKERLDAGTYRVLVGVLDHNQEFTTHSRLNDHEIPKELGDDMNTLVN